jgi:hypothetical protein
MAVAQAAHHALGRLDPKGPRAWRGNAGGGVWCDPS